MWKWFDQLTEWAAPSPLQLVGGCGHSCFQRGHREQYSLLLAYHETEESPFAHFLLKILHLLSLECLLSTSLLLLPLFSPLWKGVKKAPYVDSLCSQCFQKTLSTGTNCCDCKLPFIPGCCYRLLLPLTFWAHLTFLCSFIAIDKTSTFRNSYFTITTPFPSVLQHMAHDLWFFHLEPIFPSVRRVQVPALFFYSH